MNRFEVGDKIFPIGEDLDGTPVVCGRKPDGTVIVGYYLGPAREGRPIHSDANQIVRVKDGAITEAVDLDLEHKGPVRTANPAFREGYDRVFGGSNKQLN